MVDRAKPIVSRRTRRVAWIPAALGGMLAWPATASAGCVWSDLVRADVRVAVVKPGTPRVHFIQDQVLRPGCPGADAACRLRSFVVPGDVVLVGHRQGAFVCAGFQGPRGSGTIDWLPVAALSLLPPAAQRPRDWAGHWVAPEQDLTITTAPGGALKVSGEATWGAGDPARAAIGGVHTGEANGTTRPVDGVLAFAEGEDGRTLPYDKGEEFSCRIRMIRRGPYLLVRDNMGCGGVNVSFSGFYARKR